MHAALHAHARAGMQPGEGDPVCERLLSGRTAVDEANLRFFVFIRVYTTTKPQRRKIYDLF
ncbi:MAG TPA: hypothetical protein DCY10_08520 [Clostridiales bacterium]|nr:hypothetical protein [Clostridiales bacterium]